MLFLILLLLSLFSFFYNYLFILISLMSFLVLLCLSGDSIFFGPLFMDVLSFNLIFLTSLVFLFCFISSLMDYWNSNSFWPFTMTLGAMFFLLFLSFSCFNTLLFYFSFELLFFIMFLFLLNWGYSPERLQASFYMVFYTLVVSFPFLVTLVMSPSHSFGVILQNKSSWWGFFLLVFLVKLPTYGMHLWLPKAHVEAPVSGSMLLAGVLLKLGIYGMIRFINNLLKQLSPTKGYLLALGLLSSLLSCFLCMRQSDLKAFVAYSSICHMGFALSGLFTGTVYGSKGTLMMALAHGYCSSCLFFILYIFYERYFSRSVLIIKGLKTPILMATWFLFAILNMGVPPSFAFFSEIALLSSISSVSWATFGLTAPMLFLAGSYCIYLYILCSHGKGNGWSKPYANREVMNTYIHVFYIIPAIFFFHYLF